MKNLSSALLPATMHTCVTVKHVKVIEIFIITVKKRVSCSTQAVTYIIYPKLMTAHLLESMVVTMNKFRSKGGVPETMSPATTVIRKFSPDSNSRIIYFGSYVFI